VLKIRLFGTGEAMYLDQHLHGFPNHKACMLLCYLLINQDYPQSREKLAAIFWGDSPSLIARKNLRHVLWSLRQALQSIGASPDRYLFSGEDQIAFLKSSDHWLDIEGFEAAINSYQPSSGGEITQDYSVHLEKAVDLYIGDLLENNYEDWCLYDRERLRSLYLKALSRLLRFHSVAGNYERSLQYGHRLLAKEPASESIHRQLICLYWLSGDRSSALAQYHRCRQILREELGVSPMDDTQQLYEQIKGGQSDAINRLVWHNLELSTKFDKATKQPQPSENLLKKLHELQQTIDESRIELRQLEKLIRQTFAIHH
jgi:DNA-binding SARP family transcriptional activator